MVSQSDSSEPVRWHLLCGVVSALILAFCPVASTVSATPEDAPLEFRDESIALNDAVRIYRRNTDEPHHLDYPWQHDNAVSQRHRLLARVRVQGHGDSDEPLLFGVEAQPDKASYELCYCPLAPVTNDCVDSGRICEHVEFAIAAQSGVMYLVAPNTVPGTVRHYFRDFIRQRLELSVTAGEHKVYRQVMVEPPKGVPDCDDYPDTDPDRYTCLFLGEVRGPAPTADQAILNALPDKLVQPKENYDLVFSEDFEGSAGRFPAGDCEGGLSNLDGDKWNFRDDWCHRVDLTGEPCENMRDGHYEMSTFHGCASNINTVGKFTYKYGYAQTQYTIDLADSYPQNLNMVIGDHRRWLKFAAARYGAPLRNYEEMAKGLPIELNPFEYFPDRKRELTNYFYNYHPYIHYPHTEPRSSGNWTRFCYSGPKTNHSNFFTAAQCEGRESLTVTKGLEWTPRGYRMLVKVKDLHDDFIVVRKDVTSVGRRIALSPTTPTTYVGHVVNYSGSTRDGFFEFLEPGNPDSVLTNFAVGHAPMKFSFGAWRGFGNEQGPEQNPPTVRMRIDYARIFQPKDRYVGMEPVYE